MYEEAIPSVVSVYVTAETDFRRSDRDGPGGGNPGHPPEGPRRSGAGSGFVYDDEGHLVTNQHVVSPPRRRGQSRERASAVGRRVDVRFSEGDWRTGEVVGVDPYTDLAVVRVEELPAYADPLPIAASNPAPGRRVAALGNPMGLDGTITKGIVSGTNRATPSGAGFTIPDAIQTDAAINPGNSGGPLVTTRGEVVGVNRAKQGENIGFAVSPDIVNRVVPELIADGAYRHSYLNVRTVDVSPTVAEANRLDEPAGVLVVDVRLGPASGGLRGCRGSRVVRGRDVPVGGDVIVGVDGRPVRSHEELTRYLITETSPDESVSVDLIRDGERLTERVTLAERPRPGTGGHVPVR
ncbi:S1C family serine protease [Halorussus vallis]|uniref:S1C family serine protease n=1 Tax=Halorussus vallis TaxID=2953749 RepID=UPI00209E0A0B|nr:trypsin-like peptidase domain-containing protein [Halorussus vallis]